ncbi:MAG: radical SAM family heme chaperone HemW [Rhodovibrionaceae bacterium]
MSEPLAVYIHWPFCKAKCPYCDFNSHVRESIDQAAWRAALLAELRHDAEGLPGREVVSIFFGGGTPSLMAPETAGALIEEIGRLWPLAEEVEITLEANPTSSEAANFRALRAAGVNRLSLGVQALDEESLRFLGREHSAQEALAALEMARASFPRFSFDLIYARPEQSLASWRRELTRALEEGADHLSLYQLTIEENTVFHGAWRRGELRVPEEEAAGALFDATQEIMENAGLPAYEISNHARPGQESRHNLAYWTGGDYLGIGPGAHGRLTRNGKRFATRKHRAPEIWLRRVGEQGHASQGETGLSAGENLEELLLMGLRLRRGVTREDFRRLCGAEPESLLDASRLGALRDSGDLELDAAGLRATAAGQARLNALLGYLLT